MTTCIFSLHDHADASARLDGCFRSNTNSVCVGSDLNFGSHERTTSNKQTNKQAPSIKNLRFQRRAHFFQPKGSAFVENGHFWQL
jgi:hypothetical protein